MAYKVYFSEKALADQRSIISYMLDILESPDAARHFLGEVEAMALDLEYMPSASPYCREPRLKSLGYQKYLLMSYIALFKVENDAVYIAHIFHQSQNYARLV